MKALINRRTIIIFSTAVLLAIISIVSVNVLNSTGPVTGAANVITRPVRALASTVARTFSTIFASMYEYEQLQMEKDELQRRIAQMEIDYRESQRLREENERFRLLLGFSQRYLDYQQEMASVEGPGGDNWSSSLIIDKGYANSGIARGMGVVTEEGVLIGQVFNVGATSSTVITVLDTKFSASAYVGSSDTGYEEGTPAVARGDFTYMGSGMLVLDQISSDIIVRTGDTVVTSGHGGVYPRGLIIGQVADVIRHPSGIDKFAPIEPMVSLETITDVFIITGFDRSASDPDTP